MTTAILWFRRDLRLGDNAALRAALAAAERVVPVYIHAPAEEAPWAPGAASRWWLHHSLAALDRALQVRGAALVLHQGPSAQVLGELAARVGAGHVYANQLPEPHLAARDRAVATALARDRITLHLFGGALLGELDLPRARGGGPYRVFTPYWRACEALPAPSAPRPAPRRIPVLRARGVPLESLALLPGKDWADGLAAAWQPGEAGARALMQDFLGGHLEHYDAARDWPARPGVSRLSPHLHFGEVSSRSLWHAVAGQDADARSAGAQAWLRQLRWRDFAHYVLHHWPDSPTLPVDGRFAAFPWRTRHGALLRAWQQGRTGIPMVDAGMRQLWATGWMHNRVRMLVASYLVKNCRIPWQVGARWFWDTLVDADLANNTFGWQWTAGCGMDAAPYFRIFNPVRQGERFDPQGAYVRRWIPELAALPDRFVHSPWRAPVHLRPARYPVPAVDLDDSRREALAAFAAVRAS